MIHHALFRSSHLPIVSAALLSVGLAACDNDEPATNWPADEIVAVRSEPENLGPVINSPESEYNPELSADGLVLFFSSRRDGGFGENDIWMSRRESPNDEWGEPENLGDAVNTDAWETGPSLTGDLLTLFFTSKRPGVGGRDIYVSHRDSTEAPFDNVEPLDAPVNTEHTDSGPYISYDGLLIVFSSTRPGGVGDRDLYMGTRSSTDEPFTQVHNLGPTVNSKASDSSPAMTEDKLTLYFHSRRREGTRKHDIFMTTRESLDAPWSKPVFLGGNLNTLYNHEGTPSISIDGKTLYFRSDRDSGHGYQDIWKIENPPTRTSLSDAGN